MKYRMFFGGAMGTVLAGAFLVAFTAATSAAEFELREGVTEPLETATVLDGGPADILIFASGAITVTRTGAAVLLNSDNLATNGGFIINNAVSGAIGIQALGGFTGAIFNSKDITIGNTNDDGSLGSGNYGVIVNGTGTHTGSITFGDGSFIDVLGDNSAGVAIFTPLDGSMVLSGAINVRGVNAVGIITTAPVAGSLVHNGSIVTFGANISDSTTIDPESGGGIVVGASVASGILNNGPAVSGDEISIATITSAGSKPTLYISPSAAGTSASDLTIGVLPDAADPTYSVVNRGNIIASSFEPGVNSTGIKIEGDGTFTATLTGGLFNSGTMSGVATSDNFSATDVATAPADAFGIAVGSGGIVPRIRNEGNITATTSGPAGGTAAAVLIEAGASVGSLVNTGLIFATAATADSSITNLSAYAIRDLSGTLTSITNSGTISVSGTALDGGSTLFAADLSKATSAVTFANSGKLEGEIAFGQAGNTFIIDGADADVRGRFFPTGAGTLDINVEQGSFLSDRTMVRDFTVGSRGTIKFALSRTTTTTSLITATGATTFAAGSRVVLTPSTFVPNVGTYTLLTSAGGLTFANFADTTALPLPFLFNGSFSHDANTLFLTLQRKTAAQLGLAGNLAALYEPAMDAAALDDPYGAALLSLLNLGEVEAVLTTMTPTMSYGARELIAAVTDHPTGPIGVRQRDLITSTEDQTTFFAQEFYLDLNTSTNPRSPSFFASGMGGTTGTEWGAVRTGRIGVAYTFYAGQVTENNPRTSKANITLNLLSLYGGWRLQDFFVTSQTTMGFAALVSKRLVLAGPVTRTVTGNWSGYLGSAGVATGFIIRLGAIEIIPQVSVDGLYVYQTSYSESGGDAGANLNIGVVATQSVRLFAGVVAQSDYNFTGGMFRPQLLAGWAHEVMDDAPVIDASFQALPGSQFSLVGPTADQSKFVGGASLAYTLNNWTAGLNYGASASSNSLLQSAGVKLTSRF